MNNNNNILKNKINRFLEHLLVDKCKRNICHKYTDIKNIKLSIYEYILRTCTVYARMKPKDKSDLILSLKKLPNNSYVGMCGDGANDCLALSCADIGISLCNNNESSICSSFTSNKLCLHSIVHILIEGRASLVNSFQLFKFISLYSIMQCSQVLILYSISNKLTDNQYIFIDIVTILPLSIFMCWTSASEKLSKNIPIGKLFSFPILISIYGQIIIQLFFVMISLVLLMNLSFYKYDKNKVMKEKIG